MLFRLPTRGGQQLGFPVVKVFNSILATSIKDLGRPKGEKDHIAP
jgi:hypothetical protein